MAVVTGVPIAMLRALTCGTLLATLCAAAQAPTDLRVALVIGNAAYASAPLLNPANDAKAMGDALRGMGFTVIESRDASKAQMVQAIAQARDALKGKSGVGMLYYAGHGLQLDWHNYMVPVDARLAAAADVPNQAVDLQLVVDAFKAAGNRLNIVVLDACRDNPFEASASGKGLAPLDAPPGTFLAYATAPGNVAEDGDAKSGNGLYTQYLVRELKGAGARIEDVFKRVRLQVRKHSQGRQVPWESTSLEDDFYFDPKAARTLERSKETAFEREKTDWDRVKDSSRADDIYAFLQSYPNGLISEQAQFRLDQLQKIAVRTQPAANGVQALASGVNRYAVGDELVLNLNDLLSGRTSRIVIRVTAADEKRVVFNNSFPVLDQMGGVLHNRFGVKEPANLTAPADIALGKRWRSAYTNTKPDGRVDTNFWDFRVVALEDITVPAGTFKAYRLDKRGESRSESGAVTQMTGTAWVDPVTMMTLRGDFMFSHNGKVVQHGSDQLVSYKRAPRQAP